MQSVRGLQSHNARSVALENHEVSDSYIRVWEEEMSQKCVKRKRSGADEDIVNDLPQTVIACILGKMPIREAVRTSVLSKKWRSHYLYIPQLVFDDQFCKELDDFCVKKGKNIYELKYNQFDEIITKSLMLHPGGLERFKV
ncbi:hypothetical protein K7X08_013627 [Anisodus acutangulus]|uniref:F-box domain-containing protein n=1 Tax=Anisodus acutangulus TaxID=402998 RepID=A0A9Q1LNA4_9SOLA|nr:hypothetical protein K7X08_013627 [Anisodus acutangulus]